MTEKRMIEKNDIDNFIWAFHRAKYKDRYLQFPFDTIIKIMEKRFGSFDIKKKEEILPIFAEWHNYKGNTHSKLHSKSIQEYLYKKLGEQK